MKQSIREKLQHLAERFEEIAALLADAEIIADQDQFRALSKEYAELMATIDVFHQFEQVESDEQAAQQMLADDDKELRELADEELLLAKESKQQLEDQLQRLMLPTDPRDGCDVYLEIRAGTGGDEAALFAGDLFRMYSRYADTKGWRVEMVNSSEGDQGGFKEIISRISGPSIYSQLKFESGVHRVQRVPSTESQGRVHTSACTVAVMAEVEEVHGVEVRNEDLRIDTYRASGAGGQHVNKTDSAVRITHLPSGTVVECQDERSQHKNKARAMGLLKSRLLDVEQQKQQAEQAATRKSLVGSGDRSERIRTYNFPQGRLTDHRINLTLYKLDTIIQGDLDEVIQALLTEHQADMLAQLAADDA